MKRRTPTARACAERTGIRLVVGQLEAGNHEEAVALARAACLLVDLREIRVVVRGSYSVRCVLEIRAADVVSDAQDVEAARAVHVD
jgi:hypothetical protein